MDDTTSPLNISLLESNKSCLTPCSSSLDFASNEKPSLSQPYLDDTPAINQKAISEAFTKRHQESSASRHSTMHRFPSHVVGGLIDTSEKTKQCNCRQSSCLKLYCECFSSGIYCSVFCTCDPCKNNGTCFCCLLDTIYQHYTLHNTK